MLTIDTTIEWLGKFNEKIQENKAYLSELDGPIGDGDHGANMAPGGAVKIERQISNNESIGSFKLWKCLRNL